MLLKNGKVFTVTKGTIDKCDILIEKGAIKAVGKGLKAPKDEKTIDLNGLLVFPGFIDAHCHLGVYSEPSQWANEDGNEEHDPVTAQVRAIDAVNLEDMAFGDALKGGITSIFTGPGSANVIGGQSLFMKTGGSMMVDRLVLKEFCGLKAAMGENPKRVHGAKSRMPSTRMGVAAVMREAFTNADNYMKKKKKDKDKPEKNLKLEAIAAVLLKKVPLRCHAHRADDIATIVRIKEEFGFDLVIEHCTDGHKIAEFLAEKKIPCVIGPSLTTRVKEELKDKTFKTVNALYRAGVLVAIMTDAPVLPINYLPMMAGLAVKEGLPWDEALKCITINAANICGVSSRVGSIEVGKDADFAIYDGDPFTIAGKCKMTIINGEVLYKV